MASSLLGVLVFSAMAVHVMTTSPATVRKTLSTESTASIITSPLTVQSNTSTLDQTTMESTITLNVNTTTKITTAHVTSAMPINKTITMSHAQNASTTEKTTTQSAQPSTIKHTRETTTSANVNQTLTTTKINTVESSTSSTVKTTEETTKPSAKMTSFTTAKITSEPVTQPETTTMEKTTTQSSSPSTVKTTEEIITPVVTSISTTMTTVSRKSPRCYECIDIPHPADCTLVTVCPDGQTCVVEEIVTSDGLVLFNSGCQSRWKCAMEKRRKRDSNSRYSSLTKRSDITTCIQCCDGDFCNDMGCGQRGLPRDQRGPLCFKCDVASQPDTCRHVAKCDVGDVCMLTELEFTSPGGDPLYRSDCVTPAKCHDIGMARVRPGSCHECCIDDYCNAQCRTVVSLNTTSTPVVTTSTTSSTQTTTTLLETTSTTTTHPTTTLKLTLKDFCHQHQNYHYSDNHHLCYKFHFKHKTWDEGNATCSQEGGTMAILQNTQQWQYLRDKVRQEERYQDRNVYIGGRYAGHHDFIWADGSRVQFTEWAPNEPSAKSGFCIHLSFDDDYKWHDTDCQNTFMFICTIRL